VAGIAAQLAGQPGAARLLWAGVTVFRAVGVTGSIAASVRRREVGVDVIALLAMGDARAW